MASGCKNTRTVDFNRQAERRPRLRSSALMGKRRFIGFGCLPKPNQTRSNLIGSFLFHRK
jgi:hypothetical protein